MGSKIKNFNQFVNESYNDRVDEGFLSYLKKYGIIAAGWAYQLLKNIVKGLIAPIPHGPKKGLPTIMLFLPENGPVSSQIEKYSSGINPLSEAELPIEYTNELEGSGKDQKSTKGVEELYTNKYYGDPTKNIFIKEDREGQSLKDVGIACDKLGIPALMFEFKYIKPEDLIKDNHIVQSGILPTDNGKDNRGGIIFIDQMDKGDKNLINYFNNIVKNGQAEGYILPDKWVIVASGENPEEIGDISGFDIKK